jgi:hypothetical protein
MNAMRGKELISALACATVGVMLACGIYLILGDWPSPVIYYSAILIGVGGALVGVRYGRLGPFEGELGSPGLETLLRERIDHEVSRASRYGRELTILAVRSRAGRAIDWSNRVRAIDHVVHCRKGVVVLLLPETSSVEGLKLLRRFNDAAAEPLRAVLVSWPADGATADDLSAHLLGLIRASARPGEVVVRSMGATRTLPITS